MAALFKLILFLALLYLIARSVGRLLRAMLGAASAQRRVPPPPPRQPHWQGQTPARSRRENEDIEDARWVDLG